VTLRAGRKAGGSPEGLPHASFRAAREQAVAASQGRLCRILTGADLFHTRHRSKLFPRLLRNRWNGNCYPVGKMRYICVLLLCVLAPLQAEPQPQISEIKISEIEIVGVSGSPKLATRAGDVLDPASLQHDMKTLWQSQRLSDLQVETVPDGDRVRVLFRASERRMERLDKIHVSPPTPGITMGIEPGAEIDGQIAQQIAAKLRQQLEASGYPEAAVHAQLLPASSGKVDLDVHIDKGPQVDIVGPVAFTGNLGVPASDLRHALRATSSKTMVPLLWHLKAGYSEDAIESDAANLRSFYYKRGYFDASVRSEPAAIAGGKARLAYAVNAGPRYQIREFRLGEREIAVKRNFEFPAEAACQALFAERRKAERKGILDFSATLEVHEVAAGEGEKRADLTTAISTGPAYQTGFITFQGNRTLSDLTLRRAMLLEEGAPIDEIRLRKSVARLGETGFFEPVTERSVLVNTPPGSGRADVTIFLKERKKRSWALSGPVGPMSTLGPLEFAIGSRLPPWGRGILELSTYTVSAKLMYFAKPIGSLIPFLPNKRFLPLVTIGRPMLPGQPLLSGYEFTPLLGWQGMLLGYGASQMRGFLRPLFDSERNYLPALAVTIERDGNLKGTMYCGPAKTKLDWVRQISGTLTNLAFSFVPF